ncbi:hypothetical protein ACTMTI_51100 [Nonomuraea sp. H19]|uniref:hypothetical protein n=1 Tax=Nonomuraea sp. H19 TaxID=3452206 RepID=UPI003F88FB90
MRNEAVLADPRGQAVRTQQKARPVPGLDRFDPGDGRVPTADTPFGRLAGVTRFDADFPALMRQARTVRNLLSTSPSARGARKAPVRSRHRLGRVVTAALTIGMFMGVAACGDGRGPATSSGTASDGPAAEGREVRVGVAYDIGGRGDKTLNDATAAGLDKAKAKLGFAEINELEAGSAEPDAAREERLRLLVSAGYNPINAVRLRLLRPDQEGRRRVPRHQVRDRRRRRSRWPKHRQPGVRRA